MKTTFYVDFSISGNRLDKIILSHISLFSLSLYIALYLYIFPSLSLSLSTLCVCISKSSCLIPCSPGFYALTSFPNSGSFQHSVLVSQVRPPTLGKCLRFAYSIHGDGESMYFKLYNKSISCDDTISSIGRVVDVQSNNTCRFVVQSLVRGSFCLAFCPLRNE